MIWVRQAHLQLLSLRPLTTTCKVWGLHAKSDYDVLPKPRLHLGQDPRFLLSTRRGLNLMRDALMGLTMTIGITQVHLLQKLVTRPPLDLAGQTLQGEPWDQKHQTVPTVKREQNGAW